MPYTHLCVSLHISFGSGQTDSSAQALLTFLRQCVLVLPFLAALLLASFVMGSEAFGVSEEIGHSKGRSCWGHQKWPFVALLIPLPSFPFLWLEWHGSLGCDNQSLESSGQ